MTINLPDNYQVNQRNYQVNPVEFYRIQLCFICPDVHNTKLVIMAYLYHYGYQKALKKIIEDKIVISMSSLYNFISSLRKEGLIEGYENDIRLPEGIKLIDDNHITLLILIKDDSKNEIGHKYFKV